MWLAWYIEALWSVSHVWWWCQDPNLMNFMMQYMASRAIIGSKSYPKIYSKGVEISLAAQEAVSKKNYTFVFGWTCRRAPYTRNEFLKKVKGSRNFFSSFFAKIFGIFQYFFHIMKWVYFFQYRHQKENHWFCK